MTCSTSYLLYYTLMDPWNVLMHACVCVCVCVSDCTYVNMYDTLVSRSVSTLTSMVPPDCSLPPSTSTPMKTPDPQPPYLSASLTEPKQTPEKTEGLMMALNKQLKEIS